MGYVNQTQHRSYAKAKKTLKYKAPHVYGLAPEIYLDWNHHWRKTVLFMMPTKGKQIFHSNYT
jgi:hypothetical protein